MILYLIILEILLLVLLIYSSYMYFVFKYKSTVINAIIKEVKQYEIFQRPSNKMIQGEKRALKIKIEYRINDKKYTKVEKVRKDIINVVIGDSIKVKIVKNDPAQCSLKPDSIRFRNLILTLIFLVFWSILTISTLFIM